MADAKSVIRMSLAMSEGVVKAYLDDLSDEDFQIEAIAGINPLALQVGHLINAEFRSVERVSPGASPTLPDGFMEPHDLKTAPPGGSRTFLTKAEYLDLWAAQRKATLAVLDALPEEQLDQPTGIPYAPTVAALFNAIGGHILMHTGQFVALRRKLNKPVVI
ncbi:DinB family protein [Singulisphaera sp. PoT]|uniref:DinB family protein n=1 Tax=Singulisphaera sp. PoT TaxID=3411797 RepID=UPI003BF49081